MATVLISKQFINDLSSNITRMQDDDIKFKCGRDLGTVDLSALRTEPLRYAQRLAWGADHVEWATTMPEKWKKTSERFDIRVATPSGMKHSIVCTGLNKLTFFPPGFFSHHDHDITEEELLAAAALPEFPEAALVKEAYDKVKLAGEIKRRWNETRTSVVNYFNACPSVNRGLQLTPAMRMYIPAQYLKKIDDGAAKQKKERVIPQIDGAALAAQAVEVSLARSIHGGA